MGWIKDTRLATCNLVGMCESGEISWEDVAEMCESGEISWQDVARDCLQYMIEDAVRDMAESNDWIEDE